MKIDNLLFVLIQYLLQSRESINHEVSLQPIKKEEKEIHHHRISVWDIHSCSNEDYKLKFGSV